MYVLSSSLEPDVKISVSVIIPTYNRAATICDALNSVLEQTSPVDEIIVVDDGSTDNTLEILQPFQNRIRLFSQDNRGVSAARNLGLQKASMEWITFLDSDDVWLKERISLLQVDLRDSDPSVVLHVANLLLENDTIEVDFFEHRGIATFSDECFLVSDPLPYVISGISPISTAVRRDAAIAVGGFLNDLRIFEDALFFSQVALLGSAIFRNSVVARARRLPSGASNLSSLASTNRVEADQSTIRYLNRLLKIEVRSVQQDIIRKKLSGAYFVCAFSRLRAGKSGELLDLWMSFRTNPSKTRGFVKMLVALIFRSNGYRSMLKKDSAFKRS